MRELLRLSRLADAHSIDEFRNPTSLAHRQMVEILQQLARQSPIRLTGDAQFLFKKNRASTMKPPNRGGYPESCRAG